MTGLSDGNAELNSKISQLRRASGFLTPAELLALSAAGNIIHDPFSTLISRNVRLDTGNFIYPNVLIECRQSGLISIGSDNVLLPNTVLICAGGTIEIGDGNQFGENGVSIKANTPEIRIRIGNHGRYMNGVEILGNSSLGSGSQLLGGYLSVQNCVLEAGDSWRGADPDRRGGVIKGSGFIDGAIVSQGEVINGRRVLMHDMIERQIIYHPEAAFKTADPDDC